MNERVPKMSMGRVLVVEDDADSADVLQAYLKRDGFQTLHAADGMTALTLHARWQPDLVLLDIMLPGLNGNEVMATLRRYHHTPIIMVTAMAHETERISALLYGADDYVVKPYNPGEVVARVHAVLRRSRADKPGNKRFRHQSLVLDEQAAMAAIEQGDGGLQVLDLTRTEFNLLAILMATPNKMFARSELLAYCTPQSDALERVIDAHIYNLRRKLEQAGINGVLLTVRGLGYRFSNPA